jgi:predicted small secreted protein
MKDRIFAFVANNSSLLGFVAILAVVLVMLTGCNTVAGMGTDITRSAEWTKDKMSGSKDSNQK